MQIENNLVDKFESNKYSSSWEDKGFVISVVKDFCVYWTMKLLLGYFSLFMKLLLFFKHSILSRNVTGARSYSGKYSMQHWTDN